MRDLLLLRCDGMVVVGLTISLAEKVSSKGTPKLFLGNSCHPQQLMLSGAERSVALKHEESEDPTLIHKPTK